MPNGSTVQKWYSWINYSSSSPSNTETHITITSFGVASSGWGYDVDNVDSWAYINGECVASRDNGGLYSATGASTTTTHWSGSVTRKFTRGQKAYNVPVKITATNNASYHGGTSTGTWNVTVPAKPSYTVSYNANGGSGAPSADVKWYGETLTLDTAKPTRTGYTFKNWNTASNGTGTTYSSGASYTANANGGTDAPESHSYTYASSTAFNLRSEIPTRTGYTFKGWSTSSTATSASYSAGQGWSTSNAGNYTLYAVWEEHAITINYYSNYADKSFVDTLTPVSSTENVLVRTAKFYYDNAYEDGLHNYSSETSGTYLARTGYKTYGNWITTADSDDGIIVNQSTAFSTGQELAEAFGEDLVVGHATVDVYAQWIPLLHDVIFDANGGDEVSLPDNFVKEANNAVVLSSVIPTREKHIFGYWSTTPSGLGIRYYPGDTYNVIQDGGSVTLYARWAQSSILVYSTRDIEAVEIVEGSSNTYFDFDGRIHCSEIIEDEDLYIGDEVHCREIIERAIT